MTLIELLSATVLLTLMSTVLVPIFKHAPALIAGDFESRITPAEVRTAVDDLLAAGTLDRAMIDRVIAGQQVEIAWPSGETAGLIHISLVTHSTQLEPVIADPQNASGAVLQRPFQETYAWLRFECETCAVHRVFALPQPPPSQPPRLTPDERRGG